MDSALPGARSGDGRAFERLVAPYRNELRAHCYRMSGSLTEADDLLQESLLRAWKGLSSFEGRSSVRTWLYKITTNACLDSLGKKSARLLPMDRSDPAEDPAWLEPCPEDLYTNQPSSPEGRYGARESVALAFMVALQLLPPKQRAVLILRDVLGWEAAECAELLDLSLASVNSALQRARDSIASRAATIRAEPPKIDDARTSSLLARYIDAWELADVSKLVALLHEDATLAMPPLSEWIRGAGAIGNSIQEMVLTPDARGRFRLVPTRANGLHAFAAYQKDEATGELRAMAIHLLGIGDDGRIESITAFLNPKIFPAFGLPEVVT